MESISERVLYTTIQISNNLILKVIVAYSPTCNEKDDTKMYRFYEDIEKAMASHKATHTLIIGDFNAKIGKKQDASESFMGSYGYGDRNSRGTMLTDFLQANKLFHMSSFFQKRPERKWTWLSPGGRTKNEIDYIFGTNKFIVQDVTVLNNFYTGSDHRLIRAKITLNSKLERYTKLGKSKSNQLDPLKIRTNEADYKSLLKEELGKINSESMKLDEFSETLNRVVLETSLKVAKKCKGRRDKFTQETQILLQQRRDMITKGSKNTQKFKELCKTTREHVERDVEAWKEKTVQCVIEKHRGPKVFCKALQSGNHQITKIKDMNGVLATDRAKILKVIENYYQVLYSPMTEQPSNINRSKIRNIGSEEIPDIDSDEIWNALSKVKSGKAGGEDGIVPEMLKEGGESLIAELADLFNRCLSEGNIPKNWENAIVILLYKKGCKADLNNYRPISLLSQTYKLFSKILTNRLTRKLDFYQPREQAGFRQGYSTIDHILAVRVLIEKSTEYQIPIWLAFVDYKKAFDSVETWAVSESLRNARVDNRYINIIESIYSNATLKVAIPYHTKPVKIQRGVRQGDTISPKLFTLVLEDVFKKLDWEDKGLSIAGARLSNLRFADDVVLFASDPEELQTMVHELHNASLNVGLEMNLTKTKVMTTDTESTAVIKVRGTPLEIVNKYVYLGQEVKLGKENQETEINRRVRLGWAAFAKLDFAFRMNLTSSQKARIYNQCILPVLTYGAETWVTTKAILQKLIVTQRAMERRLVGVSLRDRMTNKWLRKESKVSDIVKRIANLKWQWAGHIARKSDSWCKDLLEWRPWEHKRPVGRPQMRWKDDIRKVAGQNWMLVAQDRARWKGLKEAYTKLVEEGLR
ncbi:hypothetical protein ABMA28_016056 [Loxostege sticticalis]|uniref:Reverse transcriptase domain-containing protein n=1 Tax=Loxostege sticticalis TaxID=481309 RepID=A0ABD0T7H1_LOXSC